MDNNLFRLNHVACYAKHHYNKLRTDNIFNDMRICLIMDGYQGDLMNNNEIVSVILNSFKEVQIQQIQDLYYFYEGINPYNTWKHGYYTNQSPYSKEDVEYDYKTAVLHFMLSTIAFLELIHCVPLKTDIHLFKTTKK